MKKEIKIVDLTLRNFKGIHFYSLKANGAPAKVFGDNGTGKTTLFDGFVWLLFDKDSQNKKDFQIKMLTADGKVIHGHEHEVECLLSVNGTNLTLRKVYSEKWTRKRGSATSEFTGHTTDYYIDGVPVQKKDFADRVSEIVSEDDIFKLLTSPSYFNDQLHWKKRREVLLEVCGGITDEEVISVNPALAELPNILKGRSIEDHRKVIAARRAEINKELDRIPVRIDEVQRSMPDVTDLNETSITNRIIKLKSDIEEKETEISRIKTGDEISVKEKQLREIESELIHLKNQHQSEVHEKVNEKRQMTYQIQREVDNLKHEISDKERQIKFNQESIKTKNEAADQLRAEWHEVNNHVFAFDHDENCPTCGQGLPEDHVNDVREKALSQFNVKKAERLERIVSKGKSNKQSVDELEVKNSALLVEINETNKSLTQSQKELEKHQSVVNQLQLDVTDISFDPLYIQKTKQMDVIKDEIQQLHSSVQDSIQKVQVEINSLKREVLELEQEKAKFIQVEKGEERMEELNIQQKELAREFEKLEQQLFLTEEFIRSKVSMLEEKINSKFKYARFKLFKTNINGGIEEVCETIFNGVPYSSGLNNAARINVGLDIISTLSEHYGVTAPIFVDNSEAVTKLIDINSQVISLVVSEKDKELRIETREVV